MITINGKKVDTRSKFAKGLDYFSLRITFFLLASILLNQLGLNIYLSIVLASLSTAILNRQVNVYKQKRLTKAAREKSLQENLDKDQHPQQNLIRSSQAVSFLLSGLFLLSLALFFQSWFKFYFLIFSVVNFTLAGVVFFKLSYGVKTARK